MIYKLNQGNVAPINLESTVSKVVFGMDWETDKNTPDDLIIDLMMIALDDEDVMKTKKDIFFFSNKEHRIDRYEIIKLIDKKEDIYPGPAKGKNTMDKQQFYLYLDEIPQRYKKLVFAFVVFEAEPGKMKEGHNLSKIQNITPQIFNQETRDSLIVHEPYSNKQFTKESCFIIGEMYRDEDNAQLWRYKNVSEGYIGNLSILLGLYMKKED